MKKFLMLTVAAVGLANAFPASLFAPFQQSVVSSKDKAVVKAPSFIDNVSAGYMGDVEALDAGKKREYTTKINEIFGDRFSKVTLARQLSSQNKVFEGLSTELFASLKEAAGEKFTQEALNSVIAKTLSVFKKQKNKSFANLRKLSLANLKAQFKDVKGKVWSELSKNNMLVPVMFLSSFVGRELSSEQAKNLETLMENVRAAKGAKALKAAQKDLQDAFKQIFEERAKNLPARMKDAAKALKKETEALKALETELKALPEGDARIEEKQKAIDKKKKEVASIEDSLKADEAFTADFENIDLLAQIFSMKEVVVAFEKEGFEMSSLVAKEVESEKFQSIDAIVQLKDKTENINKQVAEINGWLGHAANVPAFLTGKVTVDILNSRTDAVGGLIAPGGAFDDAGVGAVLTRADLSTRLTAIKNAANPAAHANVLNDTTVLNTMRSIAAFTLAELNALTVDDMIGLNYVLTCTKNARIKNELSPLFANNLEKIKEMKDGNVQNNKRNEVYGLQNSLPEVQKQTLAAYLHLLNQSK